MSCVIRTGIGMFLGSGSHAGAQCRCLIGLSSWGPQSHKSESVASGVCPTFSINLQLGASSFKFMWPFLTSVSSSLNLTSTSVVCWSHEQFSLSEASGKQMWGPAACGPYTYGENAPDL